MGIRVCPVFDAYYYAYYLFGLRETEHGKHCIHFGNKGFPIESEYLQDCFCFLVEPDGRRVFIDARDGTFLDPYGLRWCDVYGKVNMDTGMTPQDCASKVRAIGPSFGVRIWSLNETLWHALRNYLKSRAFLKRRRQYLANYWRQYRQRLPLADYRASVSRPDYIFFTSTVWAQEPHCSNLRFNFVEACQSLPGIRFEGGMVARPDVPLSRDARLTVSRRYAYRTYMANIRDSAVAFNTPAVAACHGWKLGEYLALGKAIVSTPLSRSLPADLQHGEHIHFVDGSIAAIQNAVSLICRDDSYRRHLELGARNYFEQHLAPGRVVSRLLGE